MLVRANIDPLTWENQFFNVNSAIVRLDDDALPLTVERLAGWSRVQVKIAAHQMAELDALQQLGFSAR
ncbi:TDP-fucosamine acetyltransferase [Kluyvera cryocrescens]|uniref:TDP-fucosamine acetyltransferase n=1 Tax=Kluyvera cryocrescens TaxID=580 RepID=A0A485B865_KLUCR|nr:TDP-fucosamine acetyltransferase [Kluyvera cryocrescens]